MGDVPRQIVQEAEEWGAGLVVLGTHGRSGFQRLVLGSTAEAAPARRPEAALAV